MSDKPALAVRTATENDLPRILEIYAIARDFMRANGNSSQWGDGYPSAYITGAMTARDVIKALKEGK